MISSYNSALDIYMCNFEKKNVDLDASLLPSTFYHFYLCFTKHKMHQSNLTDFVTM